MRKIMHCLNCGEKTPVEIQKDDDLVGYTCPVCGNSIFQVFSEK